MFCTFYNHIPHLDWILNQGIIDKAALVRICQHIKRRTFPTMITIVLSEPDYLSALPKPPHVHCPAWQLWQRRGTRPEEEVSQAQEAWKEASVESEQLSALAASSWLKSLKRSDCQQSPCAATPFSTTAIYSQYLQAFFFELCNLNIRSFIPRYRPQFIQTSNWLVIPLSTTRNQLLSANFEMRPSNKKISDHCLSRVLIEPQRRLNPLCHQTWLTPALSLEYTESQHRLLQTGNDFMLWLNWSL